MKYLFILLLSFYFISGCSFSGKKYSIKIDSLQTYGDNGENLIGHISNVRYKNGKVYIWDGVELEMFVYKINGEIIKKLQLSNGRGPGEFTKYFTLSFDVISDTTLVFLDFMQKRVQFISINGNYLSGFNTQITTWRMYYRDSLLYFSDVNSSKSSLIFAYTLSGKKVTSLVKVKPFTTKKNKPVLMPAIDIEDDLSIYYANSIKTEITKWQNDTLQWTFSDEKLDLIPSSIDNNSKGWSSFFVYQNYFIASTYDNNSIIKGEILLIDKNTGQLLYAKKQKTMFSADSFENNKYIFMSSNVPYPHLNRIDLKIVKE